ERVPGGSGESAGAGEHRRGQRRHNASVLPTPKRTASRRVPPRWACLSVGSRAAYSSMPSPSSTTFCGMSVARKLDSDLASAPFVPSRSALQTLYFASTLSPFWIEVSAAASPPLVTCVFGSVATLSSVVVLLSN